MMNTSIVQNKFEEILRIKFSPNNDLVLSKMTRQDGEVCLHVNHQADPSSSNQYKSKGIVIPSQNLIEFQEKLANSIESFAKPPHFWGEYRALSKSTKLGFIPTPRFWGENGEAGRSASLIMMKNIIIFQTGNDLPLTTSTGNACNFYWQETVHARSKKSRRGGNLC